MKGKCIAVCVVAGVLGLIAIILGFTAEGTRIKVHKFEVINKVLLKKIEIFGNK